MSKDFNNVYINTDIIQNVLDSINKRTTRINEIFDKTNNDFDIVKNNEYWVGQTSDTVFLKYEELKTNYESVIASLTTLNNFLSGVKEAYIEFDKKIDSSVSKADLSV